MSAEESRTVRRGREARRATRMSPKKIGAPFITRKIPLTEVLSLEGLQLIESNAEIILEEIGVEFRGDDIGLGTHRKVAERRVHEFVLRRRPVTAGIREALVLQAG